MKNFLEIELEIQNLPRLNHDEIGNLNRISKEIESVIKDLPSRRSPGPDGFLKDELTPICLKLFKKNIEKEHFLIYTMRPALPQNVDIHPRLP